MGVFDYIGFILLLPFILFLIYITAKYGKKYTDKMMKGRIIKVIERVPLGQNVFISVVLINDKPFVVSSSNTGVEILMELEKEEVDKFLSTNKNEINIDYRKLLSEFRKGRSKYE